MRPRVRGPGLHLLVGRVSSRGVTYDDIGPAQLRHELKKKSGRALWMSPFANKMSQYAK